MTRQVLQRFHDRKIDLSQVYIQLTIPPNKQSSTRPQNMVVNAEDFLAASTRSTETGEEILKNIEEKQKDNPVTMYNSYQAAKKAQNFPRASEYLKQTYEAVSKSESGEQPSISATKFGLQIELIQKDLESFCQHNSNLPLCSQSEVV